MRAAFLIALPLVTLTAWAAVDVPVPVSPGSASGGPASSASCPTFSWSQIDNAASYELLVYRVPLTARAIGEGAHPELRALVPGRAASWSPPADRCLEPGGRYAWVLRALEEDRVGEWSEPSLFEVNAAPTVAEVERALSVLRRHLAEKGATAATEEAFEEATRLGAGDSVAGVLVGWPEKERPRRDPDIPQPAKGSAVTEVLIGDFDPLSSGSVGAEPPPRTVTPPASFDLSLSGDLALGGAVFKTGYPFLHNDGGYGFGNTALGVNSLVSSTPGNPSYASGKNSTAVGENALRDNTSGYENTAVGTDALLFNTTGARNTATGRSALAFNESGANNTAIGVGALFSSTVASDSTAVGFNALFAMDYGDGNTAVGARALGATTNGDRNTAVGTRALYSNVGGDNNTAIGYEALRSNISADNTAVGVYALAENTTGDDNTATGNRALFSNTEGSYNTANGSLALFVNSTGSRNTAVGRRALRANTTGTSNAALGERALENNSIGKDNTAVGRDALKANTTSNENTAVGTSALGASVTGARNTAVGERALETLASGSSNIAVGRLAGVGLTTGSGNIYLGSAPPSNQESNTLRIGGLRAFISGIRGVTTGQANGIAVLVDSAGQLGTASSSRRFKQDIEDMGDASSGLLDLRPVTFRYRQRALDGEQPLTYGLIAEEVLEVFPELVAFDAEGRPETVIYRLLTPMLVNEMQRLHRRVDVLESGCRSPDSGSDD